MPVFEGRAILLAGNGDFNVKHYSGKFNAYQRTYVLIPYESKYYALLYMATKETIARFKRGASGSIEKFITLGDVNSIVLLDPKNDSILESFNLIIEKIEQIYSENQQLSSLRDFLLPLLMNGQVKVSDNLQQNKNIIPFENDYEQRFNRWLESQGLAARGTVSEKTLRAIFDAMDDDDK